MNTSELERILESIRFILPKLEIEERRKHLKTLDKELQELKAYNESIDEKLLALKKELAEVSQCKYLK